MCEICGESFSEASNMRRHQERHQAAANPSFMCQICSETFSMPGELKSHMKKHDLHKPHVCPFCDARFSHSRLVPEYSNIFCPLLVARHTLQAT